MAFSDLNLKDIVESNDEGEGEEEGCEREAKDRDKLVGIEGTIAKETLGTKEEAAMEEAIAEAVTGTRAKIIEATEDFGAVQTGALKKQYYTFFLPSFYNQARVQFCNKLLNVNDSASVILMFEYLNGDH